MVTEDRCRILYTSHEMEVKVWQFISDHRALTHADTGWAPRLDRLIGAGRALWGFAQFGDRADELGFDPLRDVHFASAMKQPNGAP